MILPTTYLAALLLSIFTMLCWGSWANTQKLAGSKWRFELFYYDYSVGVALCAVIAAFTFGTINEKEITFLDSFAGIALRKIGWALAAGVVFNVANILLVAAIAISGMAVAFPIAIGLALIIGVVLSYFLNPQGNPAMLFGGALLVGLAIVVDAIAYRAAHAAKRISATETLSALPSAALPPDPTVKPKRVRRDKKKTGAISVATKGIIISLISGVLMGSFYPLVQIAMSDEGMALPAYTAGFFFALGVLFSTLAIVPFLMNFPIHGQPVEFRAYIAGASKQHILGVLGGMIWFAGMIANLAASAAPKSANVGPAVSYALGQGATLISAFWGLFLWKEFRDAPSRIKLLLWTMIALFVLGLTLVSLAPLH